MSSSVSTTVGNVVVVTHVHPATQGAEHGLCVGIQKFSRSRPLALGTVEIMVGLMLLLFGIVMAIDADTLGVFSGIFVWGSLFYITAGSLTVAAGKSLSRCLVNGSLAVNVVAAVASCTGTILCFMDTAGVLNIYYDNPLYSIRRQGISGILAIFHLLELIVSLTIAGFACNATCNCCTAVPSVVVLPGAGSAIPVQLPPQVQLLPQVQLPPQMGSYLKNPEDPRATDLTEPPAYDAVVG